MTRIRRVVPTYPAKRCHGRDCGEKIKHPDCMIEVTKSDGSVEHYEEACFEGPNGFDERGNDWREVG